MVSNKRQNVKRLDSGATYWEVRGISAPGLIGLLLKNSVELWIEGCSVLQFTYEEMRNPLVSHYLDRKLMACFSG